MDYKSVTEQWQMMVSEIDSLSAEDIYTLFNPEDKKRFFEIVEAISSKDLFKLDHNGVPDSKLVKTFKVLAVRYLIEFEKENKSYIGAPLTNPISIPYVPVAPSTPENPWQIPQVYCQHTGPYVAQGPGPQVYFATVNKGIS